jgi:hypothetical protein
MVFRNAVTLEEADWIDEDPTESRRYSASCLSAYHLVFCGGYEVPSKNLLTVLPTHHFFESCDHEQTRLPLVITIIRNKCNVGAVRRNCQLRNSWPFDDTMFLTFECAKLRGAIRYLIDIALKDINIKTMARMAKHGNKSYLLQRWIDWLPQ